MTVKIYISRNEDGTEQHFRETYERNAALQIAKIFWRVYRPVKNKFYALVFNIQSPPADLVIISSDGMGIVDLKHIGEPVKGDEHSTWYIVNSDGRQIPIQNNHINPARQVGNYKRQIEEKLRDAASQDNNLPRWLGKEKFFTQGAVLFTSDRFSLDGIRLSPKFTAWLKLLWLDNIADWAQSCSFRTGRNQSHRLKDYEIEYLAHNLFNTTPWTEIDGFLDGQEPYGYLFLIEGGQRKLRLSLETEIVRIGRSRENDISLESVYVSGTHCQITHMPDGTFLEDIGSGNGTWLNGTQLADGEKRKIKSGDEIVLGPMINSLPHASSIVLKYMAATHIKTAATVIYKE